MNKILTAGRELIKGNFGTAVKSLSLDIIPGEYSSGGYGLNGPDFFIGSDGVEHCFTWESHESSLAAYRKCPPLTAVINRKAQAYINGKTWIMNTQGKESNTEQAKKIRALFRKPNPIQSWKQFESQGQVFKQVFGYNIVLPIIPAGYDQYGPVEASSLWNIPPYFLHIEETNKLFYQSDMVGIIKNIKLKYKNTESTINAKDIYLFKDITPSMTSLLFPDSRICALEMPINNIIGALESRNVLINYRGALGILSKDTGSAPAGLVDMPWPKGEKEMLQKEFERYGLSKRQWKFIITSAAVKWQQMGVPTKDLMLMEEVQEGTKSICDAYGYPPHLLGIIDPTFNNQNAAEKGLYQNTTIPEAESDYEQWNNMFRTAEFNIDIQKDYTHLPVLQEDQQSKASARKTLSESARAEFKDGLITFNRVLELLGEDTVPDGNVYYAEWNKRNAGAVEDSTVNQNGQLQLSQNGTPG